MATIAPAERVPNEPAARERAGEASVVDFQACWAEMDLPPHVREVLSAAPLVQTPENRSQLLDWALGRSTGSTDWRLGNRDDDRKSTRLNSSHSRASRMPSSA